MIEDTYREPFEVIAGPYDGLVWYDSPHAAVVTFRDREDGTSHRYEANGRRQLEYVSPSQVRMREALREAHPGSVESQ